MPEEGNIIQAYHVTTEKLKTDHDTWYLDTAATHHLTYQRYYLEDYQVLSNKLQVILSRTRLNTYRESIAKRTRKRERK